VKRRARTARFHIIGSAWDLDFSNDPLQAFMYEVDGGNEQMHIMDRTADRSSRVSASRDTEAAKFTFLHSVTKDSKGNLLHRRDGQRPPSAEIQAHRVQQRRGKGPGHGHG
jgi:hypothetical protein